MQQASSGLRSALGRAADTFVSKGSSLFARPIHLPSLPTVPRPPSPPASAAPNSTAQRVAQTTRTLASRFFEHLTTPGVLHAPSATAAHPTGARALHAATRPTIQQGLSLPARHALTGQLGHPHLPRVPAVPRNVTQVGLGTARAFHSGRPIFQSLAENAPISLRTVCEADLDVQKRALHAKAALAAARTPPPKPAQDGRGPRAKENVPAPRVFTKPAEPVAKQPEELDVYLPIAPVAPVAPIAPVTTSLIIPLAPTPTGRTPLAPSGSSSNRLLPRAIMSALHALHRTHSLRVSSLFARLDGARVWDDPGVRQHAYGSPDGTCTRLEVVFDGWDEARVRAVLGDAGGGWCEIREARVAPEDSVLGGQPFAGPVVVGNAAAHEELDRWFEGLGAHPLSPLPPRVEVESDPADSVVLPTLDLSAPATGAHEAMSPHPSDEEWDVFSDTDVLSDGVLSDIGSDDAAMYGLAMSPTPSVWVGVSISSHFPGECNCANATVRCRQCFHISLSRS